MGRKIERAVYLVLTPEYYRWGGKADVTGFNVTDMRKNKPKLSSGQVAVKVQLLMDSSVFEEFIPLVTAEIEGPDIIAPVVEVIDQSDSTE